MGCRLQCDFSSLPALNIELLYVQSVALHWNGSKLQNHGCSSRWNIHNPSRPIWDAVCQSGLQHPESQMHKTCPSEFLCHTDGYCTTQYNYKQNRVQTASCGKHCAPNTTTRRHVPMVVTSTCVKIHLRSARHKKKSSLPINKYSLSCSLMIRWRARVQLSC